MRTFRLAVLAGAICCTMALIEPVVSSAAIVEVKLVKKTLAVGRAGNLTVKLTCPSGAMACFGTVTLKARNSLRALKRKTLASGTFIIIGGGTKALNLHLSRKALAVLKRRHVLRARATIVARDAIGAAHTTVAAATLKLA
jgi:hypothetical protein